MTKEESDRMNDAEKATSPPKESVSSSSEEPLDLRRALILCSDLATAYPLDHHLYQDAKQQQINQAVRLARDHIEQLTKPMRFWNIRHIEHGMVHMNMIVSTHGWPEDVHELSTQFTIPIQRRVAYAAMHVYYEVPWDRPLTAEQIRMAQQVKVMEINVHELKDVGIETYVKDEDRRFAYTPEQQLADGQ